MRFMLLRIGAFTRHAVQAIFLRALNISADFTIRRLEYYTPGDFLISNNAPRRLHVGRSSSRQHFFPISRPV